MFLGLLSNVLDLQDAFPKRYLISHFLLIVKVLNLVSARVEAISGLCNFLLRYSKMEYTSELFFTANAIDGVSNDDAVRCLLSDFIICHICVCHYGAQENQKVMAKWQIWKF